MNSHQFPTLVLAILCCFSFGASSCSTKPDKPADPQTVKIQSPKKESPGPQHVPLVARVTPEFVIAEPSAKLLRHEEAQLSRLEYQSAQVFQVQAAYASLAVPVEAAADPEVMPEFPWPPPQPSVQSKIPHNLLQRNEDSTLKDLDVQIQQALKGAGYDFNRYFRIPNGFAIATQMERYENDGSSAANDRWVVGDSTSSSFSLRGFLTALFTGKTGQYRLFVLTVTDKPFGTDPDATLTSDDANRLMAIGWNGLPRSITSKPWTEDVDVQALVYEFEKSEGKAPEVRKPRASGEAHLRDSKILSHFTP